MPRCPNGLHFWGTIYRGFAGLPPLRVIYVKRWLAQFKSAPGAEKVEEKKIGSRKVTVVSTEGVFSSGMPGAPASAQENYALLGAIMEDAGGTVFIKVTGPKATVQAATPKFFEFLAAAKP